MAINLTQADIAAALQIDPAMVTRYKARGMPMHSIEAARAWKSRHVRPRVNPRACAAAEESQASIPDYQLSKAVREAAEAQMAQLKLAEQKGEVIRVDAVRARLANILSSTRDSLLQIPARLAPVLAAESDAARVHDLLQAELHQALARLCGANEHLGGATAAPAADMAASEATA